MTVWEIVIMMVVATVCVSCGIGVVYNSIVNTVERYQVRKVKRELEVYSKVIGEIPGLFIKLAELIESKAKVTDDEFTKKIREIEKKYEDE